MIKMNLDQFAAANKSSVATLFGFGEQAFAGVEQLVALNMQTIKTVLAEAEESSRVALSTKNPADLLKAQTATLQAAPQKAIAYGKQVQAIFAPMLATQRATFDAQVADVQAKFLEAADGAMKDAPGADKFMSLAKSAFATANNAYEGMNKASKQVSDAVVKSSKGALATVGA